MESGTFRFDLVCYATPPFYPYRERLTASAERFGVNLAHVWDRDRLVETQFYASNREILDLPRGAGYWLWKPFIILQALQASVPEALILYVDSAIEIAGDLTPLQNLLQQGDGIMLFQDGRYLQNKCYTKRDAFVLMDCDAPAYWFAPQLQAGVLAFRNTPVARDFVAQWLAYCRDPRVLTDRPNEEGLPNWIDFIDHRHDQSVLTNLMIKLGIVPYRELSSHGREFNVQIEYKDADGVLSCTEYRTAPSPYETLTKPDATRPQLPSPPLPSRIVRRIKRALTDN